MHQLERETRAWRKGRRQDEADRERERHGSRTLSIFPDDDGMYVLKGRLMPEVGALLMRAIEAASDALCREDPDAGETDEARRRRAAQRRADALELMALRVLAAGFGTSGRARPEPGTESASEPPISGSWPSATR